MPLSPPVARQHYHTRQIQCQGFLRDDGLWDIEASITDTKGYPVSFYDGRQLPQGEPLHLMQVRLTLNDQYEIVAVEAATEHSPYTICPQIAGAYQRLVGLRIGPGFNRKVRELFKGRDGCTHITELLGPMATVAFQTVSSGLRKRETPQPAVGPRTTAQARLLTRLIDSCHGWRSDGEPVRVQFPEHYTGD
ncbi:DUF2889 domain-containing protein [Silvimonas iriomotensis]|uniref:DUF2889 domain-containing protein n=1 Tax=Silvimonas iriomotensis TaxID=449662 RepID=A0ABQ2P825_9NEIS|nr:DUF2889 domain-containing protein [Silvimonas iriomotensis]GGP20482.1 hypothetical protein GCM10010970_15430 [Silvimonas iriomotensis]